MRPVLDLPVIDFFQDLPTAAQAGSCFALDRRSGPTAVGLARYMYVLVPTGAQTCQVWRYDLYNGARIQIPGPTLGANSVIGIGTCMILDESASRLYLFNAESATAGGTEWARFQYIDVNNFAAGWIARTVVGLGLGGQWSTGCSLAHPDLTVLGATGITIPIVGIAPCNDNYIFINGHNGAIGGAGPSRLAFFDIGANAWTPLAPAGVARAGAPAAGSTLGWDPGFPDNLFSLRGGGSNALDYYTFSTDAWAVRVLIPGTETFNTGVEWCLPHAAFPGNALVHQNGRILRIVLGSGQVVVVADLDGTDGAAHDGHGIVGYMEAGRFYAVVRPHSKLEVQRVRVIV